MLKRQKDKLSNRFAIGVFLLIFGLPCAFMVGVWFAIIFFVADLVYLMYISKKWKEFEEKAMSLGYDITVWGDLKRIGGSNES